VGRGAMNMMLMAFIGFRCVWEKTNHLDHPRVYPSLEVEPSAGANQIEIGHEQGDQVKNESPERIEMRRRQIAISKSCQVVMK
jgi:uncharacterized Zn-finger protein